MKDTAESFALHCGKSHSELWIILTFWIPMIFFRDEDREREETEKEERRLQRLEIEHKKALAR